MIKSVTIAVIRLVSGFFRALSLRACRFAPTCSEYSAEAFRVFSWPKALLFSLRRLFRCHPFCEGGYDPLKDT